MNYYLNRGNYSVKFESLKLGELEMKNKEKFGRAEFGSGRASRVCPKILEIFSAT